MEDGLLLPQVAKLRENLLPSGAPARGELVLARPLAGLRERLPGQPASLLKRSVAPRNLAGGLNLGVPPGLAHAERNSNW